MLSKTDIREFWEQVICVVDDECWLWSGSINPIGNVPEFAHRPQPSVLMSQKARGLAYQLAYGWDSIPMGSYVYATCGDQLCVNPFHLKLGHTIVNADGLTKAQKRAFDRFQGTRVSESITSTEIRKTEEKDDSSGLNHGTATAHTE